MKKAFCIIFILLQSISLLAFTESAPVRIDSAASLETPGKNLFFLEDKNSSLTFSDIKELKDGWQRSTKKILNFGYSDSAYWMTFSIEKQLDDPTPLLLRVSYPLLDRLELYYTNRSGIHEVMATGDSFPFAKRAYNNRDFVFPLYIDRGIHRIYLKVQSSSSLRLPIEVMTLSRFIQLNNFELAFLWMFYGLMFMLCFHNLYLFFTVKEKMYGAFSLFILAWTLYEAAHNGIGFQYLWSDSVFLQERLLPFFIALSIFSSSIFILNYLEVKKNYPYFHKTLLLLLIIPGAVMTPLSLFFKFSVSIKIVLALGLLLSPLFFALTVWALYKKNRQARFFFTGFLILLIGQLLSNLLSWGLIPYNTLTNSSVQIGSAVVALVFSLGLSDRLNSIKKSLEKSEKKLQFKNQELSETNEQLQAAMEELEAANEEFEAQNEELISSQIELQRNEEQLRIILDRLPMPVLVDTMGEITLINRAFKKSLGYERDRLKSSDDVMGSLFPDDAHREAIVEQYYEQKETASDGDIIDLGSHQVSGKSGKKRIMEIRITIADPLLLIIFHDITEQQKSREMMIQTEKMMTLGGLSAGMAHEINNPLGIITQGVQSTLKRLDPTGKKNREAAEELGIELSVIHQYMESRNIYDYLNGISEAGSRAAATISNMLSFSRKSSTEWSEENINTLIDETIELASKDYDLEKGYDFRKIKITRDYQDDIPSVSCVRSEIQQVILNLLRNASQAMSSLMENSQTPELHLSTVAGQTDIALAVRDNGPGIDTGKLQHVFEPFFTTKGEDEGTGLGLSVSQYIISERHHGSISAENNPTGGGCFTVRLPLKREAKEE